MPNTITMNVPKTKANREVVEGGIRGQRRLIWVDKLSHVYLQIPYWKRKRRKCAKLYMTVKFQCLLIYKLDRLSMVAWWQRFPQHTSMNEEVHLVSIKSNACANETDCLLSIGDSFSSAITKASQWRCSSAKSISATILRTTLGCEYWTKES